MKICVLTIATGNQARFLPVLRASIAWRFLVGHDVRRLIFTDCDFPSTDTIRVVRNQHEAVRGAVPAGPEADAVPCLDAKRTTVTVVLCTRNPRRDMLDRTLEALAAQTLPAAAWELIVVDNASDLPLDPQALECLVLERGGMRCRTVVEPVVGLTAARICGIRAARGELIVFVDDDNLLDPDYLAEAVAVAETRPDLGAFGGRITPEFAVEPPEWLAPFRTHLAIVEFDRDSWSRQTFPHDVLPCGAGMCIRRPLAEAWARAVAADPRRLALGRTGDSFSSAEDTDMALSCIDQGYATGRFTALHLTHVIPASRLELDYQLRLARGLGLSNGRLLAMRGDLGRRSRLKIQARTMLSWLGLKYRGPARAIDLAYYRGFLEGAKPAAPPTIKAPDGSPASPPTIKSPDGSPASPPTIEAPDGSPGVG